MRRQHLVRHGHDVAFQIDIDARVGVAVGGEAEAVVSPGLGAGLGVYGEEGWWGGGGGEYVWWGSGVVFGGGGGVVVVAAAAAAAAAAG
jgi:hypothetical protein